MPSGTAQTSPSNRSEPSIAKNAGVRVCEGGKAANPLDLLGRKGQREEVADRLLEPGEDEVGAMWRQPPHEELERGPLVRHARGEIAGHHRELVQVGDRTQGPPIGPERDGRLRVLVHHAGPAVRGRSSQSGALERLRPAGPGRGRVDIQQGRKVQLCRVLVDELPAAKESSRTLSSGPPPDATGPRPPGPRAGVPGASSRARSGSTCTGTRPPT